MTGGVRHRHVFFLAGFDPKGAAWYHRLYREQAARQAAVTGVMYEVGARRRLGNGNTAWDVRSRPAEGRETAATVEHVRWEDIVRAHWPSRPLPIAAGALAAYLSALTCGRLRRIAAASPRTLVSLAWPAAFWLGLVLAGVAAAVGAASLARLAGAGTASALAAGTAGLGAVAWAGLRWEQRLNTAWLLRIYRFAHAWSTGRTPEVAGRVDALADDVLAKLRDPAVDEVLLVGFSVGSLLAISTVARVRERAAREGLPLERLRLLTLGHCIPLLGAMRPAVAFRADLGRAAADGAVPWVDYSSPVDWGSFPLADPVALCMDTHGPAPVHLLSPRFHTMFARDVYESLRRDKRRMHLQYLMAGERPSDYDWFAITAGPLSLPERIAATRAP